MSTPNILSTAASLFMTCEMAISSKSFTKTYKQGKAILAAHDNAQEDSFKNPGRVLFPPGYDLEFKALKQAEGALRTWFHSKTAPYGVSAAGNKADGARIVHTSLLADGSFMSEFNKLYADYQFALDAFLSNYTYVVGRIATNRALGDSYDPNDHPPIYQVQDKFAITLKGPFPIADVRAMDGLRLRAEDMDRIEQQMLAEAKRSLGFAQQKMAAELADYLKTMATQLGKLNAHARGEGSARAPAIYDTLTTNVADAVAKIRMYAIPDTDAGSRLIALADDIDQIIDPSALDADYLKASPHLAGEIARNAASLAEALSGQEWDYH